MHQYSSPPLPNAPPHPPPCQNEVEMSKYNLDEADIEEQRARFDLYEKEVRGGVEGWRGFIRSGGSLLLHPTFRKFTFLTWPSPLQARRMLTKRLPIPAYDHVLKLSHTFNLLDARGAVGVTERANCFAVMRQLAKEVTGERPNGPEQQGVSVCLPHTSTLPACP